MDEPAAPIALDYAQLEFLAAGQSGMVYGIDAGRVLKQYYDPEADDARVERDALALLGEHPNIVRVLGATAYGCPVLERGQTVRALCRRDGATTPPATPQAFAWLRQAALGLQHVHRCGLLHADVGCHNMIVARDGTLKLIDFQGCGTADHEATACYEWFSYRQADPAISIATDIFAFGCAAYEILTGRPPLSELASEADRAPRDRAMEQYARQAFPEVDHLPFGAVVRGCWTGRLATMEAVVAALDAEHASLSREEGGLLKAFSLFPSRGPSASGND